MEYRQRSTGRVTPREATPPPQTQPAAQIGTTTSRKASRSLSNRTLAIIGGVVLLVIAGLVAYQMLGAGTSVDRSKYQAVFLDNGHLYFGKLHGWSGNSPELTDVYYFQPSQQSSNDSDETDSSAGSQTLIKLGEEIHKPTDKIILNKDAVLFIENLEDDGQVVEAIKKDKESE